MEFHNKLENLDSPDAISILEDTNTWNSCLKIKKGRNKMANVYECPGTNYGLPTSGSIFEDVQYICGCESHLFFVLHILRCLDYA